MKHTNPNYMYLRQAVRELGIPSLQWKMKIAGTKGRKFPNSAYPNTTYYKVSELEALRELPLASRSQTGLHTKAAKLRQQKEKTK